MSNAAAWDVSASLNTTTEGRSTILIIPHSSISTITVQFGPNSKPYVESLNNKIVALEASLAEKDRDPDSRKDAAPRVPVATPDSMGTAAVVVRGRADVDNINSGVAENSSSSCTSRARGDPSMLRRLLSPGYHISVDPQARHQLRCFGSTANCYVLRAPDFPADEIRKLTLEQDRRAQRIINSISLDTHDYRLQLFWEFDNAIIPIIYRQSFEGSLHNSSGTFYSGFLHLCILAIGFKYADQTRPDIARHKISKHESIFHLEAKFMVDYGSERLTTLASIAALLLLGDLERRVGRDHTGWLYTGMGIRFCFDMGLHIDGRESMVTGREFEAGRLLVLAAAIYDTQWALLLGRPISMGLDSRPLKTSVQCSHGSTQTELEAQIYESLINLAGISARIPAIADQTWKMMTSTAEPHNDLYIRVAGLSSDLENWYSQLPKSLKWAAENTRTSPASYFLLHM